VVVTALLVPLLASLVPVLGGACVTTQRAISTYGLGGGFGRGWLHRQALEPQCLRPGIPSRGGFASAVADEGVTRV
jgi:hypothetical protein